jgi:hypothetical protein
VFYDRIAGREDARMRRPPTRFLTILAGLVAVVIGAAFAACGDDDSGTGTDAQYVADICKAQATFRDALKALDPTKLTTDSDQSKALVAPVTRYVNDVKAANPPKDVKPYHDKVVQFLSDGLDKLKKGDPTALNGEPEQAPQTVRDRLQKIADGNEDCKKTSFTF